MDKRAIIEERKKQFAPILEARRVERERRSKQLHEQRKADDEERQKSIEKSQALAAAVRAAKEQADKDRMEAIIKNQQLSIFKARQEARHKEIQRLLREQEAQERLEAERALYVKLQTEKDRIEKESKILNHPMKRFLSPIALKAWLAEPLDRKSKILDSWESLRDYEVESRKSPSEKEQSKDAPLTEADTLPSSSVPSP